MADREKAKSAPQDRVVRVFISSTFRDIQEETGALAKRAFSFTPQGASDDQGRSFIISRWAQSVQVVLAKAHSTLVA